jgi:hypothetical protein
VARRTEDTAADYGDADTPGTSIKRLAASADLDDIRLSPTLVTVKVDTIQRNDANSARLLVDLYAGQAWTHWNCDEWDSFCTEAFGGCKVLAVHP